MRAAVLAIGALLAASPAHAFVTGDSNGGSQGAYTDQGDYDSVPAGGGQEFPVERMDPPRRGTTQPDVPGQDQAENDAGVASGFGGSGGDNW